MYLKKNVILLVILLITFGCSKNDKEEVKKENKSEEKRDTTSLRGIFGDQKIKANRVKVLVLPNANSYEYTNHGYNFTDVIGLYIGTHEDFERVALPFDKSIPVSGIYSKYYCKPFIEKTNADFIIMTKFIGTPFAEDKNKRSWGYGIKVLNTKTMIEKESMRAENLKNFDELKKHIRTNIYNLKIDLTGSNNE